MNEEWIAELIKGLADVGDNWPTLIDLIIDNIKNIIKEIK